MGQLLPTVARGTDFGMDSAETVEAEIWTLSGQLLGRMEFPAIISGWGLARGIHREHPPPPGSYWKLVVGTETVRDGDVSLAGAPKVDCVAERPPEVRLVVLRGEVSRLLRRGLAVDQLPLESRCMWTYAVLRLDWGANQPLDRLELPAGLQELHFGDDFDQPLDGVQLPPGLRELHFGKYFAQRLDAVQLPPGLRELHFGNYFNRSLDGVQLPLGLRALHFGRCFNRSLDRVQLPPGLQELHFGACFDQRLDGVQLPAGLRVLRLPGLQELRLGPEFDHSLDGVRLPEGCEVARA